MNAKISSISNCTDSQNLGNVELKNNWNHLDAEKGEAQIIDESDCRNLTESPPIETLVESINWNEHAFKPYDYNGSYGKRIKLEHRECDAVNMVYYKNHEPEDDCEAFGRCVTAQIRQMTAMQKLLAQRLISEVCFRGQIQTLQMTTTLTPHVSGFHPNIIPVSIARHPLSRGTDRLVMHQQQHNIRPQTHVQMNGNTSASSFQRQGVMKVQQQGVMNIQRQGVVNVQQQGVINVRQQADHTSASLCAVSDTDSSERIQ